MKARVGILFLITSLSGVCLVGGAKIGLAQGKGKIIIPDSSIERPEDLGKRAHTNHLIFLREGLVGRSPAGEIPASLGCVYQIVSPLTSGCPIKYDNSMPNPSGGSGIIAVVDAFDYPTAENDLNVFSAQFNLPACTTANGCFKKVFATGSQPRANCGWAQESALDIQWAHAMAPNAKIVLVEAASSRFTALFQAVDVATNEVLCGDTSCPGGSTGTGEVSISWGSSEFSSEASLDSHFNHPGVVYFAASGDSGGKVIYPSASPAVVSAGGTTINRDGSGNFASETAWSGSGGGASQVESRPSYQDVIVSVVGSQRGTPDLAFDSSPSSGVSVYDTTSCRGLSGWLVFGGTSIAAPSFAGIVNLSGHFNTSSANELGVVYSNLCSTSNSLCNSNFRDIVSGSAGSFSATTGWDFITGVGSDLGTTGK